MNNDVNYDVQREATKEILFDMENEMKLADMALKNVEMGAIQLLTEYKNKVVGTLTREEAMWLTNISTTLKYQYAGFVKTNKLLIDHVLRNLGYTGDSSPAGAQN